MRAYVGVDLHRRRSLAVCLDGEGERLWWRRFDFLGTSRSHRTSVREVEGTSGQTLGTKGASKTRVTSAGMPFWALGGVFVDARDRVLDARRSGEAASLTMRGLLRVGFDSKRCASVQEVSHVQDASLGNVRGGRVGGVTGGVNLGGWCRAGR